MTCQKTKKIEIFCFRFDYSDLYQWGLFFEKKGMMDWPRYLVGLRYAEGCDPDALAGLIRIPGIGSAYPELMHSRSQGTRVEAQDFGGPPSSLDAPASFR
jgi:hypothetical protein